MQFAELAKPFGQIGCGNCLDAQSNTLLLFKRHRTDRFKLSVPKYGLKVHVHALSIRLACVKYHVIGCAMPSQFRNIRLVSIISHSLTGQARMVVLRLNEEAFQFSRTGQVICPADVIGL